MTCAETGDPPIMSILKANDTPKIRLIPSNVADAGKVRLGGESPSFGPVRLAPAATADAGKVRLGGESPSFGPVRG
jgi:hypothetical protein